MKYYKSLKFCKVFNFFESIEEIRYLLVLDDYMELPELTEDELTELKTIKEQITSEYNTDNIIGVDVLFENQKVLSRLLYDQRYIIDNLFILNRKYKEPTLLKSFNKIEERLFNMDYGLTYSNESEFYNEIDRLAKRAVNKNNQIKRKKREIELLIKSNNTESKDQDYISVILMIERYLNIRIDIYKDTMPKFIKARKDLIVFINKSNKKNTA